MIDAFLSGLILGFLAGIVPGPYTALVAGNALHRGFKAGARLAFVPLVTEIPPMVAASFALIHTNPTVLRWVGALGGGLFVILGVRLFVRGGDEVATEAEEGRFRRARTFLGVATAGLLSPAPWLFWFVVAGPLLVRQYNQDGWGGAVLMAVTFLALMMGTATTIAWGASHGQRLPRQWQRRLVRATACFLMIAGSVLLWQSAEGDFNAIMGDQKALREILP